MSCVQVVGVRISGLVGRPGSARERGAAVGMASPGDPSVLLPFTSWHHGPVFCDRK